MKKILVVLPNDSLGGAEQVLKLIVQSYKHNKESRVHVFFLKSKTTSLWDDFLSDKNIILEYSRFNSEFLGIWSLFILILKNRRFDYLFTSQVLITGFVGFLIRLKLLKVTNFIARESTCIFIRFTGVKLYFYKLLYFIGYKEIDLLICQTNLMAKSFRENLKSIATKINVKVIPNPVDTEKLNKMNVDCNFILEEEYIVSAGRLIKEKGFDVLIKAFIKVKKEKHQLKLMILGEGKERGNLEKLIEDNHLERDVILKGFVKDVYPYFKKAKICVVSSHIEGFPNVLLQMMSQNTKIVSTLCAGGIENLSGVFTVPVNNIDELRKAIENSLDSNTNNTELLFNTELKRRSIENFMKTIKISIYNEK